MKRKTYLVLFMCSMKDGKQTLSNDIITCKHKSDAYKEISAKYRNDENATGCVCLNIICLDD